jgi:UDP-N-acetylglucosamine transferase subunit ALG13
LIFATVGTHQQPFERMLDGLLSLPNPAEVVVQYGYGQPPRGVGRAVAFMSFGEMEESFGAADTVITHAGVGSILCARRAGHVPIVVPRLRALGEHVDDHQVELTRALAARGAVEPVWEGDELADAVERVPPKSSDLLASPTVGPLAEAVRDALLDAQ